MNITKLIKKPIGKTKIDYFVTVDGPSATEAIDAARNIISKTTYTYIPAGEDKEKALIDKLGEGRYYGMLQNHVMGRIAPFVLDDEDGLEMAFEPECSSDSLPREGEEFTFTIHVLLKSKCGLSSYDPVSVKAPRFVVPEEAIDAQIDQIAQFNTVYKKAKDDGKPVEMGQFVQIDMRCVNAKGEELPGLCGEKRLLELDYGFMPKGFIDEIVGMTVGQTKTFDFEGPREGTMSEDDTETYTVTVTVNELQRQIVPKISDAWVEVNMPDAGDSEGLRAQIRERFEAQVAEQQEQELGAIVDAELAKRFEGKISDEVYEACANNIYNNMITGLAQQNKTLEQFMEEQGATREQMNMQVMLQARTMIRQGFSLDALYDHLGFDIDDEDIEQAYTAFSAGREDEVREAFRESHRMYSVREVAKRLKAHRWLMETAEVEYEDVEVPADAFAGNNGMMPIM